MIHSPRHKALESIVDYLAPYLHGKLTPLRLSLICFFSRGHLLIEDLPGLGKTTLAIAIARALGLRFGRIQCTSDLLPSDITGLSIYDKNTGSFEFHQGPIFNNLVLVDEINRTTPKTQSALLEAMQEKQVTADGKTYALERPFFVIATQNSSEQYGTFTLPDSQLDRFMLKISIGYPPRDAEKEILKGGGSRDMINTIEPLFTMAEVAEVISDIRSEVQVSERILDYVLEVVNAIRESQHFIVGLSTRGALALVASARTNAYFNGRDYVIPEDIKELAPYVIAHRILFREEFDREEKKEIVRSLIDTIPVLLS
jgi:MoxR-like ATPase